MLRAPSRSCRPWNPSCAAAEHSGKPPRRRAGPDADVGRSPICYPFPVAARTRPDKDYYGTLGVDPGAGSDEIRSAYRKLALRWHPDRNPETPSATERFQEISEAYAVLIDPEKRRQYDLARRAGAPSDFPFEREDLFRDMFTNPFSSSIFEELAREFERMGMRVDRQYFQQTLFGGRVFIMGGVFMLSPLTPFLSLFNLARTALAGSRSPAARDPATTGRLPGPAGFFSSLMRFGQRMLELPATLLASPAATRNNDLVLPIDLSHRESEEGTRKVITIDTGAGREELAVRIPAGVRPGNRLRLRGKGRLSPGGSRGDLYLEVRG